MTGREDLQLSDLRHRASYLARKIETIFEPASVAVFQRLEEMQRVADLLTRIERAAGRDGRKALQDAIQSASVHLDRIEGLYAFLSEVSGRLSGQAAEIRGLILHRNRLLMVNAYPGARLALWCAPGGGVDLHASLPENLIREVFEETGLTVAVGAPALVNEFHDPGSDFHQVDIYFRCTITAGYLDPAWKDPEGVVDRRRFFTREELAAANVKPDSLAAVAWADPDAPGYDPLEPILK